MKKNSAEKVYAFIDGQNLYLGIKEQGWKLDYKRFRVYLKDKYQVQKAYIFLGYLKSNDKLYKYLRKSGFELIFKPVVRDGNSRLKGNVDAELVFYTTKYLPLYDKAVLISGDGDFTVIIEHLYQNGKLKIIMIPNKKGYSKLLLRFKKDIVFMNDLKVKLRRKI